MRTSFQLLLLCAAFGLAACGTDESPSEGGTTDGITSSQGTTGAGETTGEQGTTGGETEAGTTGGETEAGTTGGETEAGTTGGETEAGTTGGETGVSTGNATGGTTEGSTTGEGDVPFVELAVPEKGFQVHSYGRWIQPGTDVEFCEVITLPGTSDDVYYANRLEVAMHPWSHHVIIGAAELGSSTEAGMEDGMSVKCASGESAYGPDLVDVIGAQAPYNELVLPEGIGRVFYGGQKVVVDYHYFNPTLDPIPARHAINFHLVEPASVEHIARSWGFYNFKIFTLPGEQAKFAAECTFDEDVVLHMLTRHTHKWGTDFHVWKKGGENDGEHLWTSDNWELDVDLTFEEPIFIPKGEGFRFQCEYDNTTDHLLTFGLKASDEMCILFGIAWSPDGVVLKDQNCDAKTVTPVDMD